jgi:hypothetical protein
MKKNSISLAQRRRSAGAPKRSMLAVLALSALTGVAALASAPANGPRFLSDDPLWLDNDAALDASKVKPRDDANSYDFIVNTFGNPGERRDVRAMNVNTLDEVPDSSWFVNRIGRRTLSVDEIVRGPDRGPAPSLDGWVVVAGKATGVQPGFRMQDPSGQLYQIELDPPSNPELATGAEIIGTAFYHAFGYHTVEVYLADLDPSKLTISDKATVWDPREGRKRRYSRRDLNKVLERGAQRADGRYRVLASRFADGRPLGNFRYYGTRTDDPNDITLHEHRRELRGARVFGAWLNHDDSRGINSLDMLTEAAGRRFVKHYMFDFGSIMGSGTVYSQRHRPGNEYILEWKPGWLTLASLGLYTRPWMHIDYPDVPASVGRFEGDAFDPLKWKPEYPNTAFENMRPDDAFWAARIVSKLDAAAVRAVVGKAQYSDPRATEYMAETLLKRREKVLRAWLTGVNPTVDFALSPSGELRFDNAAVAAGVASAPKSYRLKWARFDNATGVASDVGAEMVVDATTAAAPASLLYDTATTFIELRVSAVHEQFPSWAAPVTVHFRRAANGWTLVGLQR